MTAIFCMLILSLHPFTSHFASQQEKETQKTLKMHIFEGQSWKYSCLLTLRWSEFHRLVKTITR